MHRTKQQVPEVRSALSLPHRHIASEPRWTGPGVEHLLKKSTEPICLLQTTIRGETAIRYSPYVTIDAHASSFGTRFSRKQTHKWDDAYIVIINTPILMDCHHGSIYVPDAGTFILLQESLYGFKQKERIAYLEDIRTNEAFSSAVNQRAPLSADTSALLSVPLLNAKSGVYFHLISEALLQLHVFSKTGLADASEAIIMDKRASDKNIVQGRATALGLPIRLVDERFVWFRRAAFYTCFQRHACMNPDFHQMAKQLRLEYSSSTVLHTTGDKLRVYISRQNAKARPLDNEADLIKLVRDHGFISIDAAELTFPEQVSLFSRASVIVGPHGAGLTNAMFAEPNSDLLELRALNRASQSPSWNEAYRSLAAQMNLRYGCLMFDNPMHTDAWHIDLNVVERLLQRLDSHQHS